MATPFTFRYHKKVYPALSPTRPELSAAGKTVLITGGGKSIGKAMTQSFAIAGASHIIILGRDLEALNTLRDELHAQYPHGPKIHTYAADIEDATRCTEIFKHARENVGPVDVLILNAAYLPKPAPFATMDLSDFWKAFEINVKANTTLAQLFLQVCSTTPTLINVSSYLAWLGALPYSVAGYSGSKAAFDMVVGYLGAEKPELRVFTMHPGSVVTPMVEKVGADTSRDVYDDSESRFSSPLSPKLVAFTRT